MKRPCKRRAGRHGPGPRPARIDALATRYPLHTSAYTAAQRLQDEALMRRAWARGLTGVGQPTAPALTAPIRLIAQDRVDSDGVSEAGLPLESVRTLFAGFADVQVHAVADLRQQARKTSRDGRVNVLVSNHHARYAAPLAPHAVDLHLAVWNPFHVDVAAPAVVTWGYADGALSAVKDWLRAASRPHAHAPVPWPPPPGRNPAMLDTAAPLRSPIRWVPSLYFVQGMQFFVVMLIAGLMFKNMGVANDQIALLDRPLGPGLGVQPCGARS